MRRGMGAVLLTVVLVAGCGGSGSGDGNDGSNDGGNGNGGGNGGGGNGGGGGATGSPIDVPTVPDPGQPLAGLEDAIRGVVTDACGDGTLCVNLVWGDGPCYQGFDPPGGTEIDRGSTLQVVTDDSCGTDDGDGEPTDGETTDGETTDGETTDGGESTESTDSLAPLIATAAVEAR